MSQRWWWKGMMGEADEYAAAIASSLEADYARDLTTRSTSWRSHSLAVRCHARAVRPGEQFLPNMGAYLLYIHFHPSARQLAEGSSCFALYHAVGS